MLHLLVLTSFGFCVPRFILVIKVNQGQEPPSFCIIKQTPHMEEEVYLLPSVDQFLRRICNEKNQAWPDAGARRELASLSEELAHKKILQIIYDSREIKNSQRFHQALGPQVFLSFSGQNYPYLLFSKPFCYILKYSLATCSFQLCR